ncbi:MAG: hypothetical protein HYW08_11490 [candidate division NC10 bacterium]|nr:hypothetical protein [candidate division NC10 bacterium]
MPIEPREVSDLLLQSPGHAFTCSDLEAGMAKRRRQLGDVSTNKNTVPDSFWSRWGRVVAVVVPSVTVVLLIVGFAYNALDKRIDRLDDRLSGQFGGLDSRLRKVEDGITEIRTTLKYGPRAAALGFKDPTIQLTQLRPQAAFRVLIFPSVDLTYTILEISNDRIVFRVDGRVGSNTLSNVSFDMPFKIGEVTPIKGISGPGLPVLYITILEKIRPNEAVVVVGPVTTTKG